MGVHHLWGFSPAYDVQEVHAKALAAAGASAPTDDPVEQPLEVLLVMSGDPRIVIKTITQRLRHPRRAIHVRCVQGVRA